MNNSPIKQRILQYIEEDYASRREFYKKTGISRGTMENSTGITEETLTKIFATDEGLSPLWVITGEGPMRKKLIRKTRKTSGKKYNDALSVTQRMENDQWLLIKEKDEIIKDLKGRINEQKKVIDHLIKSSRS